MRISLPISCLAALALAACQQAAQSPGESAGDMETNSPQSSAPRSTDPTPAPTVTPSASPTTARAIPEQFRGIWDNAKGNCAAASDLRMEVGAVSIEFYESLGTVTGVTVESPDSIVVDLAMEGEGERWEVKNRYRLSNGGATLTPTDVSGAGGLVIPRKRCPA